MSKTQYVIIAAAGSLALLIGAYVFQALGYAPCKMCYWQRYPHFGAVGIGAAYLALRHDLLIWLGALAALTTGAVGVFHAGVEQKWWDGPASCTGSGMGDLTGGDLLNMDAVRVVMCDEISWQMLGLSMPAWNAVMSFGLVVVWLQALRRA